MDRLATFTDGATATSYVYDSQNRRVSKQIGAGAKTYFLYDGATLIAEMDATGAVTANYIWGATGLSQRLAGTVLRSYTFDPNGTLVQRHVYETAGNYLALDTANFDSYGAKRADISSASGAAFAGDWVGYKGQFGYYSDAESGLLYCLNRYYDPAAARWITRDPIGLDGGVNLYAYCENTPVHSADTNGLDYIIIAGGVGSGPFFKDLNHDANADNFIFHARERAAQMRAKGKKVTLLMYNYPYKKRYERMGLDPTTQWKATRSDAARKGYKAVVLGPSGELASYLNSQAAGSIDGVEYFGHSDGNGFILAYEVTGYKSFDKTWTIADASQVAKSNFKKGAYFKSWGCNQGQRGGFAEQICEAWRIKSVGATCTMVYTHPPRFTKNGSGQGWMRYYLTCPPESSPVFG